MKYKINNIIRLSKVVEKQYRIPHSKSKASGKYQYTKKQYAGMYFLNRKSCLTNQHWAISFNEEIVDSQIIYSEFNKNIDYVECFWTNDLEEIEIPNIKIQNEFIKINNYFYKVKDLQNIISVMKKPKLYVRKDFNVGMLFLISKEAKAIICPMKEKKNDL